MIASRVPARAPLDGVKILSHVIGAGLLVCALGGCGGGERTNDDPVSPVAALPDSVEAGLELSSVALEASPTTVRAWFRNASDAPVDLLVWGTPVEPLLSADVLDVRHDGRKVRYTGRLVKRGEPPPAAFVTLAPGASHAAQIDVASVYDLSRPGDYTVALAPVTIDGVPRFNEANPVRIVTAPLVITVAD